jgi:hypothetical protein
MVFSVNFLRRAVDSQNEHQMLAHRSMKLNNTNHVALQQKIANSEQEKYGIRERGEPSGCKIYFPAFI